MENKIKWLINILCLLILSCSIGQIYAKYMQNKKAEVIYTQVRQIAHTNETGQKGVLLQKEIHLQEESQLQEESPRQSSRHQKLLEINPDYRGWLAIENTNIDYPLLQGKDNETYLKTDLYGQPLQSGSLFIDCNNELEKDNNIIIYGHNMNNKTMFNHLEKFKIESFFNQNNKIVLTTAQGEYTYEVCSVYVAARADDYRQIDFVDTQAYQSYLADITNQSLYSRDVTLSPEDKILTLSTCSYEFEDARTVVHAKLIKSKEIEEAYETQ